MLGTGVYNYRSLGIRKIRKLNVSRGGREGNNALCKKNGPVTNTPQSIAEFVMSEPNVTLAVVEKLMDKKVHRLTISYKLTIPI